MPQVDPMSRDFTEICGHPIFNRPNSQIPQSTYPIAYVINSVLNGALWEKGQLHCGICGIGLSSFSDLTWLKDKTPKLAQVMTVGITGSISVSQIR